MSHTTHSASLRERPDGRWIFVRTKATRSTTPSGVPRGNSAQSRFATCATGGTFVGKDGAKKVKEILDALAAELNAPRFGKADEILARLGIETEGDFIRSMMPTEAEVKTICKCLMDGEIPFQQALQNRLCIVLGVDAYNAFVKEYNGK